jgi:uncharacterized iron-regulated membrane protein
MTPATKVRNKNWLLVKFREWHSWGGLFLSFFILVVAVTGILLNHKDLFFHRTNTPARSGLLTTATDLTSLNVSFPQALQLAREHYGDESLEKIELKDDGGALTYKVAKGDGEEIRIDAVTGAVTTKYGKVLSGSGENQLNWGKIVDDLHTGRIFGAAGKLTVDFTSGVIILLTLTGIYLWVVPWLRKRENRRRRADAPLPVARPALREHATAE